MIAETSRVTTQLTAGQKSDQGHSSVFGTNLDSGFLFKEVVLLLKLVATKQDMTWAVLNEGTGALWETSLHD